MINFVCFVIDEAATKELQCWVDAVLSNHDHDEAKEDVIDKVDERIENLISKDHERGK